MELVLTVLFFVALVTFGGFSKVRKAIKEMDSLPQSSDVSSKKPREKKEQSDYFTYETLDTNTPNTFQQSIKQNPIFKEEVSVAEESVPFDLRQAVIYQTILQNDYIADLK